MTHAQSRIKQLVDKFGRDAAHKKHLHKVGRQMLDIHASDGARIMDNEIHAASAKDRLDLNADFRHRHEELKKKYKLNEGKVSRYMKGKKKAVNEQLNEGVAMDHYIRHHNTAMEHAKNIVQALKQHKSLIDNCPSCHSGHAQDMKYLADNLAAAHLQIGQHVENEQRNAKNRATDMKRAKLLSKVKYESTAPYVNYHADVVPAPMRESQQLDEGGKSQLMLDLEQLPRHIFKQKYGRSKTIAKKQLQGV